MLKLLEARQFKATDVYNWMAGLLSWMRNLLFRCATAASEDAMNNAATKLVEYVQGGKQPTIQVFQAVRMFNPKQLVTLSRLLLLCACCRKSSLTKLTELASAYHVLPVTLVNLDKLFSKCVLSPLRCSLVPDIVRFRFL